MNFDESVAGHGQGRGELPFFDVDDLVAAVREGRLKGQLQPVTPSFPPIWARDGDIAVWPMSNTSAGGGYGDVLQRDPELVMHDIRLKTCSHWAAENIYHVVCDQRALVVDAAATAAKRAAVRRRRRHEGVPFGQFEARRTGLLVSRGLKAEVESRFPASLIRPEMIREVDEPVAAAAVRERARAAIEQHPPPCNRPWRRRCGPSRRASRAMAPVCWR